MRVWYGSRTRVVGCVAGVGLACKVRLSLIDMAGEPIEVSLRSLNPSETYLDFENTLSMGFDTKSLAAAL